MPENIADKVRVEPEVTLQHICMDCGRNPCDCGSEAPCYGCRTCQHDYPTIGPHTIIGTGD